MNKRTLGVVLVVVTSVVCLLALKNVAKVYAALPSNLSKINQKVLCKVHTYQDKFWNPFDGKCLDNTTVTLVYFVAKDQKGDIVPGWAGNMQNMYVQIKKFYRNQFNNKMAISFSKPQIVYGDKKLVVIRIPLVYPRK